MGLCETMSGYIPALKHSRHLHEILITGFAKPAFSLRCSTVTSPVWLTILNTLFFAEKVTVDERQPDDEVVKEEDNNGESSDKPSAEPYDSPSEESCDSAESYEWPEDDELIVIETGDGAPLVGTVETAESYYVVNPNQHSFNGLSPSGIILIPALSNITQ